MNYFELINKCLVELNYKQETSFSQLSKNEHEKLKNIINIINTEICSLEKWNFLLREISLTLPAQTGQIANSVNGRIAAVILDGQKYFYLDDFEKFFTNSQPEKTYTSFNDKLLFPVFDEEKEIKIIYYTADCAVSGTGEEKKVLFIFRQPVHEFFYSRQQTVSMIDDTVHVADESFFIPQCFHNIVSSYILSFCSVVYDTRFLSILYYYILRRNAFHDRIESQRYRVVYPS